MSFDKPHFDMRNTLYILSVAVLVGRQFQESFEMVVPCELSINIDYDSSNKRLGS